MYLVVMLVIGSTGVLASWCPKITHLSEYTGTFSSPNHEDLYPDNLLCTWYISAPHASLHVKLSFESFHLEDCKKCACDSLTIYDVIDDGKNVTLGTYCGQKGPPTLYSSGRDMIVQFKSDHGDGRSGFLAQYSTNIQRGSVCRPNGMILNDAGGTLTSPDSPGRYPSRAQCSWIIKAKTNNRIKFRFLNFDIENCSAAPGRCQCDFIEVRDGNSSSSFLIGRYCGTRTPNELYSTGRYMWVRFVSDNQVNKIGFVAEYTTKKNEECSCPSSWRFPFRCPEMYWKESTNSSSVCCYDNRPTCCQVGGSQCSDEGRLRQRSYCPRPRDDKKKTRCCIESGKPSCCLSSGNSLKIHRLLIVLAIARSYLSWIL